MLLKKNWKIIVGMIAGAIGVFFYWKYVGCSTGTCPISSSPIISTFYGALCGGLLGGLFISKNINSKKED